MTELQVGLIGLGAVAVCGVVVYNTWQEYRHRKLAQQVLKQQHDDVLLGTSDDVAQVSVRDGKETEEVFIEQNVPDVEPGIYIQLPGVGPGSEPLAEPESPPRQRTEARERIEPVLHPVSETGEMLSVGEDDLPPAPRELRDIPEPTHLLSSAIDYVASFETVEPVSAYQILESQQEALARVHKSVHWIGVNELTREWEPIIDDGRSEYRRIRVGLQLVDRHGPVAEADLSAFHLAMNELMDELMAIADIPPRQPALQAAVDLDEFCAGVDIQIGINVISNGVVFPGTKIRALAEAAGMVIDADGRFVRCDEEGNVLYVLLNQEDSGFAVDAMKNLTTHGLTFLLDVPRVAHGERVFGQMVDLAKRFAEVLRGALVDDNHRPLSESALEPIRRQVSQYQSAMAARKLPAGGALALRLFS